MKKAITWIIILALIAAGIGGVLWWRERQAQSPGAASAILRTGQVERGQLVVTVPASGNVAVNQKANLSFKLTGNVAVVNVAVSDRVKAGQELARLETVDLERAIRQAEIVLEQARLNLAVLQKPVAAEDIQLAELAIQSAAQSLEVARISKEAASAQANMSIRLAQEMNDKAREACENVIDILDDYHQPLAYAAGVTAAAMEAEGNVGITQLKADYQLQQIQSQWTSAYQAYQQAQQNLKTLQEGPDAERIRQAELQIEQAQLTLTQTQESLANATLVAPFDGIVAAVNIQEGAPAPTTLPAVTLLDDASLYVEANVDEIDIGKIAVGQPVSLTLDANPHIPLGGTVERIAATSSNVGGVITYKIRILLTTTGTVPILNGMTASAFIQTDIFTDVLIVPNWAVRTDQSSGETYVYRLENGLPVRTPVTVGERNDAYTILSQGLAEGDTVVLVAETPSLLNIQVAPAPSMGN
ncbi:MAG TPA: efflux RND transporter periplasmic adaptor subunit [Anaerolineae bacterium]|nr:efflux RND transporter periplasmic adaptor subunit [Anaerolineae bacterium]HQH38131.1 efflux RND transporter periplasmic adaptor subunit [Anaerolineae bacterium]